MRTIIVLLGLPCSGKSSLGKSLRNNGYSFEEEIATLLMLKGSGVGPDAPSGFDRHLMESELERDSQRSSELTIIETWHLGNLAYSRVRSPEVAMKYERKIVESLENHEVWAIYLALGIEESEMRYKVAHPDIRYDAQFYSRVKREMESLLKPLGSRYVVLDSHKPLELLSEQAMTFLSSVAAR